MINKAISTLQNIWGYPDFRPDQKRVVESILAHQDTLALLPTGGGKSICYQVPGLVLDGMVLVVSPLIALMNDQVSSLKERDISAIAITSSMNSKEVDIALENAVYEKYKFLYVSPERVKSDLFQQRFREMKVSFIAVDEAHCISQWGFDFRPSYLNLKVLRELQPNVPILALTASAPPNVVEDIKTSLQLKDLAFITGDFARPNLSYFFMESDNKANQILKILRKTKGAGIVYTYTRKDARNLSQWLKSQGIKSDFYHGGLTHEQREKARLGWMRNENPIMCATNAFGMGIDKPDVKVVIHMGLPLSIEAYYQEAGRAGRNGEKAWAILLHNKEDISDLNLRLERSFPELNTIKHIYKALTNFYLVTPGTGAGRSFPFDIGAICKRYNIKPMVVFGSIKFLEKEGYLFLSDAARTPSRLIVRTTQKALYHYSIKDKILGKTIDVLLRSYTGVFDDFQTVNETLLGQRIQTDRKTIVRHFHQLHKLGLIYYREQTEIPWLTFTEDVVMEKNLRISPENYHHLKVLAHKRLDAFTHLIQTKTKCRNSVLLRYFGMETKEDCGICDRCLSVKKTKNKSERSSKLTTDILALNQQNKSDVEIVESFPLNKKEEVIELIGFLRDEGLI